MNDATVAIIKEESTEEKYKRLCEEYRAAINRQIELLMQDQRAQDTRPA